MISNRSQTGGSLGGSRGKLTCRERIDLLLDKDSFEVKQKVTVVKVERATAIPALATAFAATVRGNELHLIDLKEGKATKFTPPNDYDKPGGFMDPALSPDGQFLYVGNFVDGTLDILRFAGTTMRKAGSFKMPGHPASLRGSTP